jgi:hypothetical protein
MQRKLTISIDEAVYEGLYRAIGPRRISQFIEGLVRPHVVAEDLDRSYAQMALDEAREADATQWADALAPDIDDETR